LLVEQNVQTLEGAGGLRETNRTPLQRQNVLPSSYMRVAEPSSDQHRFTHKGSRNLLWDLWISGRRFYFVKIGLFTSSVVFSLTLLISESGDDQT
jgi:hypothetical protein